MFLTQLDHECALCGSLSLSDQFLSTFHFNLQQVHCLIIGRLHLGSSSTIFVVQDWVFKFLSAFNEVKRLLYYPQYTLFEKSNFCPKIQFWQNPNIFKSFSSNFFWQFFSWDQSCQQLKSPKSKHFHEFFTQIFFDNFSREIKVVDN